MTAKNYAYNISSCRPGLKLRGSKCLCQGKGDVSKCGGTKLPAQKVDGSEVVEMPKGYITLA
jgi:hypothetical protein